MVETRNDRIIAEIAAKLSKHKHEIAQAEADAAFIVAEIGGDVDARPMSIPRVNPLKNWNGAEEVADLLRCMQLE